MDEARIDRAMSRIEAALARIEYAACNAPAGDDELVHQHKLMRSSVSSALSELDQLIESLEK